MLDQACPVENYLAAATQLQTGAGDLMWMKPLTWMSFVNVVEEIAVGLATFCAPPRA